MIKYRITLFIALSIVSSGLFAQADEQNIPSEIKFRSIVEEPLTLKKGFFRFGVVTLVQINNSEFNEEGERVLLPDNLWGSGWNNVFVAEYGITDRLQAEMTYTLYNTEYTSSQDIYFSGTSAGSFSLEGRQKGFGDITAGLAYQVIPEKKMGTGLIFKVLTEIPTGSKNFEDYEEDIANELISYRFPTGQGAFALTPRVVYRNVFYPFMVEAFAGYRIGFRGEKLINPDDTEPVEFKTFNAFSTSTYFSFMVNDFIALRNGVEYFRVEPEFVYSGSGEAEVRVPGGWRLSYYPYISFQFQKFRVEQVVTIPLMGKSTTTDLTFALQMKYLF